MTDRLKKGSWKTLYLVYISDADGVQEFCGLYRTRAGAVSRAIVEKNKLLTQIKEVRGKIDKTWDSICKMYDERMVGDDPDQWDNFPFATPTIKEMEVLDEF